MRIEEGCSAGEWKQVVPGVWLGDVRGGDVEGGIRRGGRRVLTQPYQCERVRHFLSRDSNDRVGCAEEGDSPAKYGKED